jgi:hypothetical protein
MCVRSAAGRFLSSRMCSEEGRGGAGRSDNP